MLCRNLIELSFSSTKRSLQSKHLYGNICAGLESGGDYFWINELFVSEDSRKQKIASSILSIIEDWAKKESIKYVACIAGLKNIPAQKLYKKNNFKLDETIWIDKNI